MKRLRSGVRQPVKRQGAEFYVLLMLVSFAASVAVTRWSLELAGYPRIGGTTLHVAHVLWGGLLLFVAALLPLVLANREIYLLGGVLGGVGVGLFIDEVGKFITQTNDYFFPAAAPIIYAFFLLTVLVYVQVRRPPSRDARAELYRALEGLSEVLDHDLEEQERAAIIERLRPVTRQTAEPELARLAQALLDFLASDAVRLAASRPSLLEWPRARATAWEARWLPRARLRLVLILLLLLGGLPGFLALISLVLLGFTPAAVLAWVRADLATIEPTHAPMIGPEGVLAAVVYLALVMAAGLPLLVAALCLLTGRERAGVTIAHVAQLVTLTVVDLLLFYFEQFQALTGTLFTFGLLLLTAYYRRRYLAPPAPEQGRASAR